MLDREEEIRRDLASLNAYVAKLQIALSASETAKQRITKERDELRAEVEQLQVEIAALREQAKTLRRWGRDETEVQG